MQLLTKHSWTFRHFAAFGFADLDDPALPGSPDRALLSAVQLAPAAARHCSHSVRSQHLLTDRSHFHPPTSRFRTDLLAFYSPPFLAMCPNENSIHLRRARL